MAPLPPGFSWVLLQSFTSSVASSSRFGWHPATSSRATPGAWTQPEALGARAGISTFSVSRIETGRRTPGGETIEKLARALGVEPGELFREPALAEKAEAPQQTRLEDPLYIPESLGELLKWLRVPTRYLANANDLGDMLEELSPKEVRRVAREVREEKAAIAEYFARLTEEVRANPGNRKAVRLFGEISKASLLATLSFAERRIRAFEEVEPRGKPSAEVERDLREAYALVSAGSLG